MTSAPPQDYFLELLERVRQLEGRHAVELLANAADEHPADPRPLVIMAAELIHAGQPDLAEGAYISALQRSPDFDIARFQLGLLQLTSGRPASAVATWEPLEQLGEDDPLRLFKRGLEALSLNKFDETRRYILAGQAANHSNEPLNRDMQKILDKLVESGLLPREDTSSPEITTGADQHFLMSSYERKS